MLELMAGLNCSVIGLFEFWFVVEYAALISETFGFFNQRLGKKQQFADSTKPKLPLY